MKLLEFICEILLPVPMPALAFAGGADAAMVNYDKPVADILFIAAGGPGGPGGGFGGGGYGPGGPGGFGPGHFGGPYGPNGVANPYGGMGDRGLPMGGYDSLDDKGKAKKDPDKGVFARVKAWFFDRLYHW